MSYTSEDIRISSQLFFHLLNNRILANTDVLANLYYDNNQVKEIVDQMAEQGGLRLISTNQNLHLVSKGENSIFASNYTQMKGKYSGLARKKHFYLANIIISIYLAEVDRESGFSFRIEDSELSYYKLEEIANHTLEGWIKRNKEEEGFAKDFALAIEEVSHLWTKEMSHSREGPEGFPFSLAPRTRLGFIHQALKPLEDEGLIIRLPRENKIIPKEELYERLNRLYHGGDRYEEIMDLIKSTKEGDYA